MTTEDMRESILPFLVGGSESHTWCLYVRDGNYLVIVDTSYVEANIIGNRDPMDAFISDWPVLDWFEESASEDYKHEQPCQCPSVNFSFSGIGCRCGGK